MKAPVVEVRAESIAPQPEYSDEELDQLIGFVQKMTTLFALRENDWSATTLNVIKSWFLNPDALMLVIFYDGDELSACLAIPLAPIFDMSYFLRQPNQIFAVDTFHDEVAFGTVREDIDGTMLSVLSAVYGPIFFGSTNLSDTVKGNFCGSLNTFLAYLTGLHFKMSGITMLYIPSEALMMTEDEAVLDRDLVKRLETIAVHWIGTIRQCLGDKEQLVPHELMCPPDHYDFFAYRCKFLCDLQFVKSQNYFSYRRSTSSC